MLISFMGDEMQPDRSLFSKGNFLLAAVSGGPDSLCLLHWLKTLRDEGEIRLAALHVNHGIRGEEADEDAAFVEEICAQWEIPLNIVRIDVPALAGETGQSLEEAGRTARYRALEEAREDLSADYIVTAHHLGDQAETVLFHLFRGAGLAGLAGMSAKNGRIIRPLLAVPREDILAYLSEQGLSYRVDSSNEDERFTRNKIRRHVLDYAKAEINFAAERHIAQAAARVRAADDYLREEAKETLEAMGRPFSSGMLVSEEVKKKPEILQEYVFREVIRIVRGELTNFSSEHIHQIMALWDKPAGKETSLPAGLLARRYDGRLWVGRAEGREATGGRGEASPREKIRVPDLDTGESLELELGKTRFALRVFAWSGGEIPENQYTKWLDYDKINHALCFRHRRPGDRIAVGRGHKSVKSYMIEQKIPVEEREGVWLLAGRETDVWWVIGYRISEEGKIGPATKRVLEIKRLGEEEKNEGNDSGHDSGGETEQ